MKNFKKVALAATCTAMLGGLGGAVTTAQAANWLMLQGTERASAAPRAKVWGFIQAQYQKDYSDACSVAFCNGEYIPPMLVGPNLESQEGFNINRARIGLRGQGLPLDAKVNYFLMAALGNNAITEASDSFVKMTDASITLNHLPGARVRVGLFKTPGAEEHLQAIHVFDYVNFTEVTNQLLLERYADKDGANNQNLYGAGRGGLIGQEQNAYKHSVSAFRDTGIQVFDTFKSGSWEHTYAVMIGNGSGLNVGENDSNMDTYLYWSSEAVYGGKGPRREGLKLFAWQQDGKRLLDRTNDSTFNPVEYDRTRSGFGVKYLKKPWRVSAEVMSGEGMIFVGPDKPSYDQNGGNAFPGDGTNGKASGYYVDAGWYVPGTKWQVDLRYDVYNRLEDDILESKWETWTVGAQYHFNLKTRMTFNYAMRDVNSITRPESSPGGPNPNNFMRKIGDRLSLQLTHIF